jgi:hypothetical protein
MENKKAFYLFCVCLVSLCRLFREQFQSYFLENNADSGSENGQERPFLWGSNISADSYLEYIQRM